MILPPLLAYLFLGEALYHLLRDPVEDRSFLYKMSLRLLLGMGGVTVLFVAQDLAGVPIGRASVLIACLGAGAASLLLRAFRRTLARTFSPGRPQWRGVSVPCVVFCIPLALIVAASFAQMTYLVPRAYDALVGWDLVGKVLSREGAYRSSVFTEIVHSAQAVYPPFTASMQGLFYLFTPEAPRLWVPLMAMAFMVVFGEEARRFTGSAALAALIVLLTFSVRELNFHLTVAQTDLPNMVFCSLAFLWALRFPDDRRALGLATLFLFLATMTRSETVLVAAGVALFSLIRTRFRRWGALWVLVPSVAFFAFWNLFFVRGLIGYDPGAHFRQSLDLDPGRAWEVVRLAFLIVIQRETFSELPWLIAVGVAMWIVWTAWGRRVATSRRAGGTASAGGRADLDAASSGRTGSVGVGPGWMLLLAALALLLYLPFFYMWDPDLNPLWTMEHTFKRGFFRYIPLIVLFAGATARLWGRMIHGAYLGKRGAAGARSA